MSFMSSPAPGWLRLHLEMEDQSAEQYWVETQANLIANGHDKHAFDAFAYVSEMTWAKIAKGWHKVTPAEEKIGRFLAAAGSTALEALGAALQKKLGDDLGLAVTRLETQSFVVAGEAGAAVHFADLANVQALRAGLTRYYQCGHFSKVRPSAQTALLIDPAINLSALMDREALADTTALTLLPKGLAIPADDLSHTFSPVRISAVRPLVRKGRTASVVSTAGRRSTFKKMSFAQLAERMLADCPHMSPLPTEHVTAGLTWSKSYRVHFDGFVKLLVKWFGDKPVASLGEADWRDFFAVLDRLPNSHHKSKYDEPRRLDEIIAIARRKVENGKLGAHRIGIGATAVNRNVSLCRTIYAYLAAHVELPQIHWAQFERQKPASGRDRGYSLAEMQQFFRLPIYTGRSAPNGPIETGEQVWHNASYWVLAIAALSGSRVGEICGLTIHDIKEMSGIQYFSFRDTKIRSLKRPASVRDIPIHPELIRLGFLEFVHAMAECGETLLFRELYSDGRSMTCGFNELVGVHLKRCLSFIECGEMCHPIRHFVSEELRLAEAPLDVRQAILGHRGDEKLEARCDTLPHLRRVLDALTKLPVLTSDLEAYPIQLHPAHLRTRRKRPDLKVERDRLRSQLQLSYEENAR